MSPGHEDRGPVSFRRLNSRANNFVQAVRAADSKPTSKTLVGVGGREPKKTNKYNSYRQNRLRRTSLSNARSEVGGFIKGPQHREFQD